MIYPKKSVKNAEWNGKGSVEKMSRLIDADALIKRWCGMKCGCEREECGREIEPCIVVMAIEEAPTIDAVEVVRGEWIDMGDFEQCSVCRGTHLKEFQSYYGKTTWIKTPYCPYCGARMKGADDE